MNNKFFSETRTFIIAEAGVNHNGDVDAAHKLIEVAAAANADAIKFQTFSADQVCVKSAPKAHYQNKSTENSTQLEMLRALELSRVDFKELADHAKEKQIIFMSTAFDKESLDFLVDEIGITVIKVPSGEITNVDLLQTIREKSLTTILSTGASTLGEVGEAVKWITQPQVQSDNSRTVTNKSMELAILHCTSEYPAPFEEINLNCIHTLKQAFPAIIGYSDHSCGISVPLAAVAMGARVIEKHFTISKSLPGPDHAGSVEPNELIDLVDQIRQVELALGSFEKKPTLSEQKNLTVIRRSLVANTNIEIGEKFNRSNLSCKRPGTGISASEYFKMLGKRATKKYNPDDRIDETAKP